MNDCLALISLGRATQNRRTVLAGLIAAVLSPSLVLAQDGAIAVNTDGVKTLKDLIKAMKNAAGERLPSSVSAKEFYKAFAAAFVEHAQEAMRQGIKIPKKIADRLPWGRKVAFPVLVVVRVLGLMFLVPLGVLFEVVLASLAVMWWFISSELKERARARRAPTT